MYDVSLKRKWDMEALRQTQIELERDRDQSFELGQAKGKIEGKIGFVENLITQLNLPDETIAQAAEVSLEFVQEIRKKIEARKK